MVVAVVAFWLLRRLAQRQDATAHLEQLTGADGIQNNRTPLAGYQIVAEHTRQIRNLIWKNYRLKIRHPVAMVFEQILPLLLAGVLVIIVNLDSLTDTTSDRRLRKLQTNVQSCANLNSNNQDLGEPSETAQSFYDNVQPILGIFFVLCYIRFVASLSASMVLEKESKIREGMRMMGLNDGPLILSWYFTYFLLYTPLALAITIETKYGNVFPQVEFGTLFFFFWTYGWSIVSFCYMITPFFNKSKVASIASVLLWILLYFPTYMVESKSKTEQALASLSAPTAFGLGINYLSQQAQRGTGYYYSASINDSPIPDLSVGTAAWFLFLDTILMLGLGWYFDKVVPQEFGVPEPYDFIVRRSFWFGQNHEDTKLAYGRTDSNETQSADRSPPVPHIEPVDHLLRHQEESNDCVRLEGLRKVFAVEGGNKVAVNHLDLTLYTGQITCLLGHNGAGKSTTISMLTGLIQPSGGDAFVFGHSIRHDMALVRKTMGVCPQHDVLYDELTVREHLEFYATIKGIPVDDVESEVKKKISEVGLTEKVNTITKSLSGGQKRKLSVAIALLGDSRIIFLDEPTSGMDPYSRRFTWNILQNNRQGRVIVLTTHFMDEADILGDRIAILSDGELCCAGSSLFLKNRYGAGYNLTIVQKNECNISKVHETIRRIVPEAIILSDVGSETVFQLPVSASPHFSSLLTMLDQNLAHLRIAEYGISVTTLEAVFLRIAHDRDAMRPKDELHQWRSSHRISRMSHIVPGSNLKPSGMQQYGAMLKKRYRYAKRDRKGLCFSIFIPIIFLVLLSILPNIDVATYLPAYASGSQSAQNTYDECVELLETDTQTQQCATGQRQDGCEAVCQQPPVSCLSADCSQVVGVGTPNEFPFCPGVAGFVPNNRACVDEWFNYCDLDLHDCDASACCTATNSFSPFYPCSNCDQNAWACYSSTCLLKDDVRLQGTINTFILSLVIIIAFSFIPSSIIAFVVKEKNEHQNAKHQQLVSGAGIIAYWASLFTWDYLSILIPIIVASAFLPMYSSFRGDSESVLGGVILLLLFGLSVIPLTYIMAFRYKLHSSAQTGMLVFSLVSGAILSVISYVCRQVEFNLTDNFTLSELDSEYLRYLYLMFPGYALQDGLFQIGLRKYGNPFGSQLVQTSCPEEKSCWSSNTAGCCNPGVFEFNVGGRSMIFLVAESVLFIFWVIYLDMKKNNPSRNSKSAEKITQSERLAEQRAVQQEDVDVQKERLRIQQGRARRDNIMIDSLRKTFGRSRLAEKKTALHNLSLGIPRGECFGYLGINGAGKSTTMKILTGNEIPTNGAVYLGGINISTKQRAARKLIGYCPQFDALHDLLTVEEHLELYASIKGVKSRHIKRVVDDKIQQLDLGEFRGKLSKGLSGGNKRKLSTAIALIGNPSIVFLDEPSTGMDPASRRKMWDVIADVIESGNSTVVLTTHSMEECEALCNRIGILVSGRLQCLGSIQHLKARYGQGYTIDLNLTLPLEQELYDMQREIMASLASQFQQTVLSANVLNDAMIQYLCGADRARYEMIRTCEGSAWIFAQFLQVENGIPLDVFSSWWIQENQAGYVEHFFATSFQSAQLVERHGSHFTYEISKFEIRLSDLFDVLEKSNEQLRITEYSVSDTTLEQIFNRFASQQEEEVAPIHGVYQTFNRQPSSVQSVQSDRRASNASIQL